MFYIISNISGILVLFSSGTICWRFLLESPHQSWDKGFNSKLTVRIFFINLRKERVMAVIIYCIYIYMAECVGLRIWWLTIALGVLSSEFPK